MRILVIEDDQHTRNYLSKGLTEAGHTVDIAGDGREGLFMALPDAAQNEADRGAARYEAIIVDRMLPGLDGLGIIRALRASGEAVPVLVLSALGTVDHRVEGLKAGSDDYLVKPFAFTELLARLEALVRRRDAEQPSTNLRVGPLELDLLGRTANRAGRPIRLQPREYRLLEFLMRRAGQVVTRTMLLEGVWDYHFDPQTNVIDVHVSRLRQKIDKHFDYPLIHTVRGAGYTIRAPEAPDLTRPSSPQMAARQPG